MLEIIAKMVKILLYFLVGCMCLVGILFGVGIILGMIASFGLGICVLFTEHWPAGILLIAYAIVGMLTIFEPCRS